ncbi:glycosyltransferase [Flammeovirga sp. EKP202]|uniref:glycosyltransferase family 2 protein n=1 Tax=Flammeovirga sp. EKP202 TaxID=2770592 RepID=UPI00165FA8D1|nr:glycosyltransferase [Flammeovirga sp. EKP202]MBD0404888.1 glycosyltransferase [Flammeovirga sp. EKP202]
MQNTPLVTIICLSYNHAPFIEDALASIAHQTYQNIETIIIDDGSADQSVNKITTSLQKYNLQAKFIALPQNIGNCKAFNIGLKEAQGKYIIDFAADDLLLEDRVKEDVGVLESKGENYGAVFSDVVSINEQGQILTSSYFKRNSDGELLEEMEEGDVYERVLRNPPLFGAPSITFRTSSLKELGGYDETLAYEDYDIWIRLSRNHRFAFYDKVNTYKRKVKSSLSQSFYKRRGNELLKSTFKICLKARRLNQNKAEDHSLSKSIAYHQRLAYYTENFYRSKAYFYLLRKIKNPAFKDYMFFYFSKMRFKVFPIYQYYLKYIQR